MLTSEIPEWRRPRGAVKRGTSVRERMSLMDAVLDASSKGAVLSRTQIATLVREEWGGCSDELLDGVLDELVEEGELRRWGGRYVRVGER